MSDQSPQGLPTPYQETQDPHRRTILDAAASLFADQGYHQTTMQMIADRAGFSVGYLYKFFPGKKEMYRELVRFHLAFLDGIIAGLKDQRLDPLVELRRSFELVSDHFNEHPDFLRIYHLEIGEQTRVLLQRKEQHYQYLVELVAAAQARGELRPGEPRLLASAIQGASKELFQELALRGGARPFAALPDLICQLLIDPLRV